MEMASIHILRILSLIEVKFSLCKQKYLHREQTGDQTENNQNEHPVTEAKAKR
jgi:hypothetical protein